MSDAEKSFQGSEIRFSENESIYTEVSSGSETPNLRGTVTRRFSRKNKENSPKTTTIWKR